MFMRWPDVLALALSAMIAVPLETARADESAVLERMVFQDCGSCHGLTMKGGLGPPLTPRALAHIDEEAIASIILDGVPGTAMPKWRPLLTQEQAMWMAHYLKSRTP